LDLSSRQLHLPHLPYYLHTLQIYTWNIDAWDYNRDTTSLYQSHPWVFSVMANGESFGVLVDTSMRCEANFQFNATRM
jgi:hypothetical protein